MIVETMINEMKIIFCKIYTNSWVKSIRVGLITIQPMILVGCILSIITQVPSIEFKQFMNKIFTSNWQIILTEINKEIYIITKILIVISVTYSFVNIYKRSSLNNKNVNVILITIVGLVSAFMLTYNYSSEFENNITASWSFIAVIISLIFSNIFIYLNKILERTLLVFKKKISINTVNLINDIINLLIIITLLIIIRRFIISSEPVVNYELYLNKEYNIFNLLKELFHIQMGWFFSGHGSDMLGAVLLDYSYINVFTNIGGAGSTIALIIGILILSKYKHNKNTAKISIIPSILNINETILFGVPVILNPIYIIPFVITPMILSIITTIFLYLGFVSIENNTIHYTVPILCNAYIVTGSIKGVMLQIVNIIIAVCIYIPFIKLDSKVQSNERNIAYNKLKDEIFKKGYTNLDLDTMEWDIKEIYDFLSESLYKSIIKKDDRLYMEYQPQVNKKGKVVGVEALLRWDNEEFGNIPPNVVVVIAEKSGIINELGYWIVNKSCSQLEIFNEELGSEIELSINVSALQFEDDYFVENIKTIIEKFNVNFNRIKLEITESVRLKDDKKTEDQINYISKTGMKLVLDDVGVGYSPIMYIKKYKINSIKIDKVLINDIHLSKESRRIVESLYRVCESYGIEIVDEFVEIDEQKRVLDEMGDGLYQGYLFSKPLKLNECIEYIKEVGFEKNK